MRRAERVVHVHVGQRRQPLRELDVVLLLLRMKSQVLEKDDASWWHVPNGTFGLGPHAIASEGDRLPEQLAETRGHRAEAHLRMWLSLGPAEMRRQDHAAGAGVEGVSDGGQRFANPRVVADDAAFERHVEIDPHEDAAIAKVEVANGFLHADGDRDGPPYSPLATTFSSRSTQRVE